MAFCGPSFTGVGCLRSGRSGAVSPRLRSVSARWPSAWRAGARGWVGGRAGLWGALATWVWGQQLQPPGSWAPNLHYYATQALNILI